MIDSKLTRVLEVIRDVERWAFLGLLATAQRATAQEDLGARSQDIAEQAQSFGGMALIVIVVAGLIITGIGVAKVVEANRRGSGYALPIMATVAGVLMVSISALIGLGAQTIFGTDSDLSRAISIGG